METVLTRRVPISILLLVAIIFSVSSMPTQTLPIVRAATNPTVILSTQSTTSGSTGVSVSILATGFSPTDTSCRIDISPSGLTSSSSTCSVSLSPNATFTVSSTAPAGAYTITVWGRPGGDSASATFTVTTTLHSGRLLEDAGN